MEHQEIYLEPNPDGESYGINGSDVQIHTCRVYERTRDSSKVRSRAIIDYRWETKLYDGHLVTVHKDGTYLAYVLHSRNSCSVRVINRLTKARALIKNFVGQVVDLAWSFTSTPLLLGISDEGGNVAVYSVEEQESSNEIDVRKYLRVERSLSLSPRQPPDHLFWCPFVPDQQAGDDETKSVYSEDQQRTGAAGDERAHLLAVYHGNKVDVVMVDKVLREMGTDTSFAAIAPLISSLEIDAEVSAVAISPDATALALSSIGGEVKFFILEEGGEINHAQTWKPHKGRPVTEIVFLDNFLAVTHAEDTFWKYALTACDGNRELKLWNCENWDCLGTLCIDPPDAQSEHTALSLTADWTSSYIFLTDIERKSLYVTQIAPAGGRVRFATFTEFPLLHPALSLAIINAGPKRFRPASPGTAPELDDSGDNDVMNTVGVQAFLYAVNPKSLLELDIRFVPPRTDDMNESLLSTVSSCKLPTIHDELSDLSADLLRSAPSASDVAKAAGTNFLDFDVGNRRSTSRRSDSPNDRTPTGELDLARRISASPNSREVDKILSSNPMSGSVDEAACLININQQEHEEDRPKTPIAFKLLDRSPIGASQQGEPEQDRSNMPTTQGLFEMKPNVPTWNQANSVSQHADAATGSGSSYAAVTGTLSQITSELSRISSIVAQQEQNLQHLKHLVASQQSMWEAVSHLLQDQQRQGSEDLQCLRQCVGELKSDQFRRSILGTMEGAVQHSLASTVEGEMRNIMIPCVTEALKPLRESIQADVTQKLASTDTVIRENIGKLMKSKQMVDAIGQAAGQAAASAATAEANATYRESFQKTIAPAFESTARALFTQMNDAFQRGTKEYLDQLQRQSAAVHANMEEWRKGVITQLMGLADQLKGNAERHMSVTQNSMDKHFEQLSKRLNENLYSSVRVVVKEEVAKAVADGQQQLNDTVMRVLRSQASTPVSTMGTQADRQQIISEINQYLGHGQYNSAFQEALQAKDIFVVNYVCQRVDPSRLFSEPNCPLHQAVIVSLLHQLASDLVNNTELKFRYMHEAIPSLDTKSLGDIHKNTLRQVHEKLGVFLQSNVGPHSRQGKTVHMLLNSLKNA